MCVLGRGLPIHAWGKTPRNLAEIDLSDNNVYYPQHIEDNMYRKIRKFQRVTVKMEQAYR